MHALQAFEIAQSKTPLLKYNRNVGLLRDQPSDFYGGEVEDGLFPIPSLSLTFAKKRSLSWGSMDMCIH